MASSTEPIMVFLASRRADLRRIASRTCGEHTLDDVSGEAWLVAEEISRKRGVPIDFRHTADQELLLRWLHCRLVRYAEKSIRFAVKLDKDWDREDSEAVLNPLARMLAAPARSEPLTLLLDAENDFDPLAAVAHSYSQASAYLILLHRFDWDFDDLSEHLQLQADTVRRKVARCGVHLQHQPSLFDGIQSVAMDFCPRIAPRRPPRQTPRRL